MAEGAGKDLIRITHYINPHMFWFKYETSFFAKNTLFELDNKIQRYYQEKNASLSDQKYAPCIDEMVGVFNFSWNRWIRAKIDYIVEGISTPPKYILWAVDYGVPLETNIRWIRPLPEELAKETNGSVHFGGLSNIVPAENNFDFMELRAKVEECDSWSPKAVKMIEDLISDAASIKFIKDSKELEGQVFGNLEITTHTNKVIKADIVLLETNQAKTTTNFLKVLKDLGTNRIPRWKTNEGNTLVFKYHSNKINAMNMPHNVKSKKDRLSDAQRCEYDLEVEKKVTDWEERNELCQQNEVTIDDITFNDSASALNHKPPTKTPTTFDDNEKDTSAFLVAGTSRMRRLERYQKNVPNPPKSADPILSMAKGIESSNSDNISKKNSLHESSSQSNNDSKIEPNEKAIVNGSDSKSGEGSDTKSSVSTINSRAANARAAKLMNKRKSLQAKVAKMPENVIPAGYDLRNLQPTKKTESVNNSVSDEPVKITGAIKKTAISSSDPRDNKNNRKPLDEVEEACVPSNLSSHLVLVHGKHVARPIDKLANANFCEDVHRELTNMRLNHIYRIQSYAWPHLMRGNSLVLVNSARTGKTISYLPAICSLIKMEVEEGRIPEGVGPAAIVVAPSSVEVEKITRICRRFLLNNFSKMSIVESYGIRNKEKAMRYLLNGCEILVSTAPALARLLSEKVKFFEPKRIQHLVIDNIDLIHEELRSDLHQIIRHCCTLNKATNRTSVQLVITTRTWNSLLNGFLKICNNPQLCIGAYIEAAVYGRSAFKLKLIEKESKMKEVFAFFDEHCYTVERTMIICNKDEEVEEISAALKDASIFEISVNGKSTAEEIELVSQWQHRPAGELSVAICTDAVLPEMRINNCQNLIHYSLPSSWSKFAYRFSTVLGYYEDLLKTEYEQKKYPPSSLILLDEENNSQLPKLIEFLQKHNCTTIPKEIINLSNRIRIQREEDRIYSNKEFCPYLMGFGKCLNMTDCKYRHTLTKFDTPAEDIPTTGIIKVKIMRVNSPTHYCVRLLEHSSSVVKEDFVKVNKSNEFLKFSLEFSAYFANSENHQTHWPINPGDLCVAIEMNAFYRCRILQVPTKSTNFLGNDVALRVKLLDDGRIIPCKSSNLLVLPEKFKVFPFQAVDLRLTDLVPFDYESEWDSNATQTVRQWIEKYVTKTIHVRAHIKLVLMDTIWVDKLILLDQLKSISSHIYTINMKKALLEKNIATASSDAIELMTQMADECGILTTHTIDSKSPNDINGQIQTDGEEKNISLQSEDSCKSVNLSISTDSNNSGSLRKQPCNNKFESAVKNVSRPIKKRRSKEHFDKNLHSSIINEKWETLPENEYTRVSVGAFYSPNIFYVQQIKHVERMEELYTEIDNFVSEQKIALLEAKIGQNCLAKYDGKYNRAKVSKVVCDAQDEEIKATIFFCDIGISATQPLKNIIQTTSRIVNFIPFQAIRCKIIGITSPTNGVWTDDISDKIYDNIICACEYLYAHPLITQEPQSEADLKYWRHEVMLIDCTMEEDVKVNEKIVEKGLAEYDDDTKHFLDLVINIPTNDSISSEEDNWDHINYVHPKKVQMPENSLNDINFVDLDINFTEEEALQLLNLPSTAKLLPPIDEDKTTESCSVKPENKRNTPSINGTVLPEQNQLIAKNTNRSEQKGTNSVCKKLQSEKFEEPKDLQIPQLVARVKCPQVIWRQSESLICLQINAPDVEDYYLKVTSRSLVFSATIQKEQTMLVLNFLCDIEPKLTSHEIRGLSVTVRLVKCLKGITWPRLIWESDKLNWLKYNIEAIDVDKKDVTDKGVLTLHDSYIKFSSSDESDHDGEYDEIVNFQNADKLYDPLDDEFDS